MNHSIGNLSSSSSPSPLKNNRKYGGVGDDHRRESSSSARHHHRKYNSPSDQTGSRYSSGGSGIKSDEERIHSLSSQLAAAQSQVLHLEAELSKARTAKNHAEHRLITLQRDLSALQTRNSEVISVMKTLESGVEALQKEKVSLITERDELRAKVESAEKNAAILSEQVSYLNERNGTLSKKCVDLLDGSKDHREKAIAYEKELERIKPRYEEMDAKFSTLNEQNSAISTRLNMYEMRERIWIREKTELEQRHRETIDKWQRSIADLRAQHEADKERALRMEKEKWKSFHPGAAVNGPTKAEVEKIERQIKDLHSFLESIHTHHKNELNRYKKRIADLEKTNNTGDDADEKANARLFNGNDDNEIIVIPN